MFGRGFFSSKAETSTQPFDRDLIVRKGMREMHPHKPKVNDAQALTQRFSVRDAGLFPQLVARVHLRADQLRGWQAREARR